MDRDIQGKSVSSIKYALKTLGSPTHENVHPISPRKKNRVLAKVYRTDKQNQTNALHKRSVNWVKRVKNYIVPGILLLVGVLVVVYSLQAKKSS